MTLKKDDKTVVKKQKTKTKVWLKPQRVEEQVKEIQKKAEVDGAKEDGSAVEETYEAERQDWGAEDDDDSSSGPSSGKTFSPEERERNLEELYRHQRNFLRRVLADTDDEEEKQQEDSEEQNTLE